MKIIDGENTILGRLASYVAKESLKGEEINVINCDKVIITGSKKNILQEFKEERSKVGSGQKGPKHSRLNEKIVKRAIRGMLPNHRFGRGRVAFKKIKCFVGTPKEFTDSKKIKIKTPSKNKFIYVKELSKKNGKSKNCYW
jgi:large subunit ribosomal protein L13